MASTSNPNRLSVGVCALAALAPAMVACAHPDPAAPAGPRQPKFTLPPLSAPTTAPTPPTSPGGPAAPPGNATAIDVARRWLVNYRTADANDPGPDAWIDRVHNDVTTAMNTRDNALRGHGGGADWHQFVQNDCHSSVTDLTSLIPPESTGTANEVNVQLTGTLITTCTTNDTAPQKTPIAATVLVRHQPTGWKVDRSLY